MAPPLSLGHFVVTSPEHMTHLVELAKISSDDFVLDIGSGDGQFLKTLVQMTSCRGLGVEVDPVYHDQALAHCTEEIRANKLQFRCLPAEELKIVSGSLCLPGCCPEVVTVVYLFQVTFQQSRAVVGLLESLLSSGVRILTNSVELPPQLVSPVIKTTTWPSMESAAGEAEHMARASGSNSGNGSFWCYQRMTKKEQKEREEEERMQRDARDHARNAQAADYARSRLMQRQAEAEGLNRKLAELGRSESAASRQAQTSPRRAKELRKEVFSFAQQMHDEFQRRELQEQREFDSLLAMLHEERCNATEELFARIREEDKLSQSLREQAEREAELQRVQSLAQKPHESWFCYDCGEDNVESDEVCAFCEVRRGSGLGAWAHSDADWETREGRQYCMPVTLQEEVEQNLKSAVYAQQRTAAQDADRETSLRHRLEGVEALYSAQTLGLKSDRQSSLSKLSRSARKLEDILRLRSDGEQPSCTEDSLLKMLESLLAENTWINPEHKAAIVSFKRDLDYLENQRIDANWQAFLANQEKVKQIHDCLDNKRYEITNMQIQLNEASARLEQSRSATEYLRQKGKLEP